MAVLCLAIVVVCGTVIAAFVESGRPAVAQPPVPTATYSNAFEFDNSVPLADRQWIVQAVAHARPEAVRLIELVDQRTMFAPLRDGSALGKTWNLGAGWHEIKLDLKYLDAGMRANRDLVVLHELGHVIDDELLPRALRARLAAEVPAAGFCRHGRLGDCAPPEEKFADTFAKWAYRGRRVYYGGAGYWLPVPRSLEAWGAPLNRLSAGGQRR